MYSLSSRWIRNGSQARPRLDPDRLEARKSLRHRVHHPVGEMQHVVPGKAQRVDGDEAVGLREPGIRPVERRMERQRHPQFLNRRIGLGIGVVIDAAIMGGGDHETDHALLVAELADDAVAGFRIVERQVEHRLEARVLGEHALAQPAVIGGGERDLDLDARTRCEVEHRRREHAGDVDAHGVHPAPHQRDVAMR